MYLKDSCNFVSPFHCGLWATIQQCIGNVQTISVGAHLEMQGEDVSIGVLWVSQNSSPSPTLKYAIYARYTRLERPASVCAKLAFLALAATAKGCTSQPVHQGCRNGPIKARE